MKYLGSSRFLVSLVIGVALVVQGCQAISPGATGVSKGNVPADATPAAASPPTSGQLPASVVPPATSTPIADTTRSVGETTASVPATLASTVPTPRVASIEAPTVEVQPTARTAAVPAPLLSVGEGLTVGAPAPDFSLLGLDGRAVRLSDFRGAPVMVNFFATWCGPCKEELPQFQATYQQYRDQGFQVLLVDLKESPTDVRAFATKMGLTMPIVVDDRGTIAAGQYQLTNLPTTVFVDANGVVRDVQAGPVTAVALMDNVSALLSGATTTTATSSTTSAAFQSGPGPCCRLP